MSAKLIAIEGLDGSGKQTQTALLKDALLARGLDVRTISFPRYGEPSAALVEDYLGGGFGGRADDVNAYAASSFFAMDRLVSYLKYWRADYEAADVFITDRYSTSNLVHQLAKLPRKEWEGFSSWLIDYEFERLGLPAPLKVIYLRVDLATSQSLLMKRYGGDVSKRDVHERDLEYLEHSREAAEWCVERYGWQAIACSESGILRPATEICEEITVKTGL